MPRAVHRGNRLYTSEITALQRLLRLTNVDGRITNEEKRIVTTSVDVLVALLSKAHGRAS